MKKSLMVAMGLLAVTALQAEQLRPITHEDVWLAKRVSAPQVSPDGRSIVFTVVEPAYEDKDKVTDLWIVAADGRGPARRLTGSRSGEADVAWSEDGTRIVFVAKREGDEAAQVYALDLASGGEARRLTSAAHGARAPILSPDGRRLAYVSDVPDDPAAADHKYKVHAYDGFPIRNWDHWREPKKPHLFVQALDVAGAPQGAARDLLAGTQLAKSSGYAGRRTNGDDALDAVWTRDGRELVFVATTNEDQAAYAFVDLQLYRVPAAGGEPVRITTGPDSHGRPRFSADGHRLFMKYERRTPKVYNIDQIAVLDWPAAGAPKVLTAPLDRPVDEFAVSADGRTVWFLAEDGGRVQLFSTPADRAAPRLAYALGSGSYSGLSMAARAKAPVIAAVWESAVHPSEIARLEPDARRHVQLTAFNDARAAAIDWQPLREFSFRSRRGDTIHSFLALPPGFDPAKKYPLFVLMHGGPHGMWQDSFGIRWNPHLLAAPGFVVLMTDYRGSTGYGEAFSQAIQGDPLRGPADDINDAADEAIRRFSFIDASRQCAGGASYGGHLANWMQASTTRYRCLVSHAGLVDLESQWGTSDVIYAREVNLGGPPWVDPAAWQAQNPMAFAAKFATPVLVTVGERDFRVPINNALEYWSALKRQRVPSRLLVFPEENHWILSGENSRYFYGEVRAWLTKYLKE
ncbi:MAG: Dipeptidyl-peptidase 5 [Steroidobacteraceae bacterium]|nr:Dipeptidyl-peptidase 5 [Steroidobacteraceae bacterium]